MHKYNFVKQNGIKECGISCMSMIIKHYGGFINHSRLMEMTHTNKLGTTAFDIVSAFKDLGFNSYGIKYFLNKDAATIILPAIAHTVIDNTYNHFVLIYEINFDKEYLIIADPADKIKKMSFKEFNQIFTNNLIIAYPVKMIEKEERIKLKDYFKPFINKKTIFTILLLVSFIYILSIVYIILLKQMINNRLVIYSIYIPFILTFKYFLNTIKNNFILNFKTKTAYCLMKESFMDLLKLPYSYYRTHTTGEVVNRLEDIDTIKNMIDVFVVLISDFIIMLFSGLILFMINKSLFIILLIIAILYLLNYFTKYKKLKILLQNLKQSNSILCSFETESILGFESIKGQNLEDDFKDKFEVKSNVYLKNLKNYQKLLNKISNINDLISEFSLFVIVFVGLILINSKIINYSDLLVFYALSNYFLEPLFSISNISLLVSEINVSINRLIELKYNIKNKSKNKIGDININNLSFKYNDMPVFSNLNINIKKGEKIALTGKSGCGKSTLLKILKQYYKANNIEIDNEDLSKINFKDNVTYISQDEYLFTDTLYNNIVLNKKISKEELNKIIDICSLDNILEKNSLKLNMLIEENGFNLSGGEIERIILARALVNIKEYLFIDEGLSEVDALTERKIIKKLIDEYKDTTIIFTTHRMDNIDLFDRVINLDSMN